jgi:hypothetical protein
VGKAADRTAAQSEAAAALELMPESVKNALLVQHGPVSSWAIHTCRVVMLAPRRDP